MKEFKVGDRVRVVGNTKVKHHFKIGDEGTVESCYDTKRCGVRNTSSDGAFQIVYVYDLELIEECVKMAHNNGDLIKAQVSRDDYGAPVYNLFVKFGEFYYNLSSPKQMRGAKNLPKGTKRIVGTMSGTGDHMLAAIEGKDSEVSDPEIPFDEGHPTIWVDDIEAPTTLTATEIMRRFDEVFGGSGSKTTSQLSDVQYAEKVKADQYL